MAKFQLCEFRRTKNSPLERGLARVRSFGDACPVEFILDVNGSKLSKQPWSFQLLRGHAYTALDTTASAIGE